MNRVLPEETFARIRDVLQADADVEVAACFGSASSDVWWRMMSRSGPRAGEC